MNIFYIIIIHEPAEQRTLKQEQHSPTVAVPVPAAFLLFL